MNGTESTEPAIVVVSSLFPSDLQPRAGIFVRERMFRVGRRFPLTVVSPQPWFPGQGLIQWFKADYRIAGKKIDEIDGIRIFRPRFLAIPGVARWLDGWSLGVSMLMILRRLVKARACDVIDAHFAYPDGTGAALAARLLDIPVTITLRGTEPGHLRRLLIRGRLLAGLRRASRVFAVSNSLKSLVTSYGIPESKIAVVGNGVDMTRFYSVGKSEARDRLGIAKDAKVLVTVGALVERKGFHRVIEIMPKLMKKFPDALYLIVGGASREGNFEANLRRQIDDLGLEEHVRFLGELDPDELRIPLSAADLFVLPSRNEGWANVILEAMACGTPVIASDVGGNAEVVNEEALGNIFPFGDSATMLDFIARGLRHDWDSERIVDYAKQNDWEKRVDLLTGELASICRRLGKDYTAAVK